MSGHNSTSPPLSPSTQRIVALLRAGWSIWAPRKARSAYAVPPKGRISRIRLSTLDRAQAEGAITTEDPGETSSDFYWILTARENPVASPRTFNLTAAQTRALLSWSGQSGSLTDGRVGEALERLGLVEGETVRHWHHGYMGSRRERHIEYMATPLGEAVSAALWQQARNFPEVNAADSEWRRVRGAKVVIGPPVEADEDDR